MTEKKLIEKVNKWLDGPGRKWGFYLGSDGSIVDGMCHSGHYTHEEIYKRWVEPQEQRKHKKSKVKICFTFDNKPQEIALNFDEFGRYAACSFAFETYSEDTVFTKYNAGTLTCEGFNEEFMEKYNEIPFIYNDEEYTISLLIDDHSVEIHKKDDEDFEEYSNFHLSI